MEQTMTHIDKPKKLIEFEILRAISVILLMFSHSDIYSQTLFGVRLEPVGPYLRVFFLGSFFFMAGFLIQYSDKRHPRSLFEYLWSKFIRLIPPYWMALALFMIVLGYTLKNMVFWVYFLNLQVIFSPTYVKQVLTLWYLSVLFVYLIIYGFFLKRTTKSLIICLVIVFLGTYLLNLQYGLFDYRFFEYYLIFLCGFLLARYEDVYEKVVNSSMMMQFLLVIAGFILFGFFGFGYYEYTSWQYILVSDFHILTMIIFALRIFREGYLNWRIWGPISYASFFIYLFHRPIWEIMFMVIKFPTNIYAGWYRLIPGAIFVFVISYYLQLGYDALLQLGSGVWKRLTAKAVSTAS
jgi:peptidoglycan/LPS O-acetylase OafA/YrhL